MAAVEEFERNFCLLMGRLRVGVVLCDSVWCGRLCVGAVRLGMVPPAVCNGFATRCGTGASNRCPGLPKSTVQGSRLVKEKATEACLRRLQELPVEKPSELTTTPSTSGREETTDGAFSLALEAMSDDDADNIGAASEDQPEMRAKAAAQHELQTYMDDKGGRDVSSGADLLQYWQRNEIRLPGLADLARQVHSTPASSAEAERTFSEAGRIVEKRRTRLLSSRIDDLLLIRDNRDLLP
ncbi:uncharacterized protein LOC122393296 [Amphibalanus amphitrite]|uniref:uncharacterized protein LOC122393296 n=1 Tax=Amphibalanus amphitrite TaxID=1232801 RepID=UPI001C90754D|nr:uncharacterized protein LOC122393296 [Amphibalanus amphitrite]